MYPCKCSWLTTVTRVVAKRGNAFLTLPALSALGQIVVSASCPLNQRHKAAYVQETLMYDAYNDSDWAIRLSHSCICHWGPCHLVFICFLSHLQLWFLFLFSFLSFLLPIPSSLYYLIYYLCLSLASLSVFSPSVKLSLLIDLYTLSGLDKGALLHSRCLTGLACLVIQCVYMHVNNLVIRSKIKPKNVPLIGVKD